MLAVVASAVPLGRVHRLRHGAVIKVLRSFSSTNCDRSILSVKERVWAKKQAYLFVMALYLFEIALYLFETLLWGLPFLVCACTKLTAGHSARGALRTHSRPTTARRVCAGGYKSPKQKSYGAWKKATKATLRNLNLVRTAL